MRKSITSILASASALALVAPVFAGGFFLVLGNPEASAEARAHHAVVTIKAAGCHNPEKAAVAATAIGLENGRRKTIPLKLEPLAEPGMYALARQWPAEGRWVLEFVASDQDRSTSTLVAVTPAGVERDRAILAPGLPSPSNIASLLAGTSPEVARK